MRAYPERVIWGNDWPHTHHSEACVDDTLLAALVDALAPSPEALQRLLVDNPQQLYRFDPLPPA